jgi:ArsR family transcriptional regulator
MINKNNFTGMENLFLALADKTRLRLLNLMRRQEVCVCFLTEVLNESQPKISRHLAYLRNANLVTARRDGKWIYYRIQKPEDIFAEQIIQDTLNWLESKEEMRKDYHNLIKAFRSTEAPVTVERAPSSKIFVQASLNRENRDELETFLL